jgi:hypothetical protein
MTTPGRVFLLVLTVITIAAIPADAQTRRSTGNLPRTADGKPNLQGIWQIRNQAASDLRQRVNGAPLIQGGEIPYQPAAAARRAENFKNRQTADPLANCYMPGVPRIMYLDYPFQIFQTPTDVAITFEWSQVYRLIPTDGSKHPDGIDFWMGDSRGRWEGDTLVVEVTNHNDKTWFDAAGDFHSDALRLVERYTLRDANTIDYEVTVEDGKVFTRPWTMKMALSRRTDLKRLLEFQCQADREEASGDFERDSRTWYPKDRQAQQEAARLMAANPPALPPQREGVPRPSASIKRLPGGKPDLQGHYQADSGGANYGIEKHPATFLNPPGRGVVVDPPDGKLPLQPWALEERTGRQVSWRGYDDPTAHCFVAGVPRSMYTPSPYEFIQTPDYLVMLFERMSWRIVPLDGRAHLPENVRLWQGDSVGHWDGDVLVVETTNLNGKTWLNEVGDVVSHAERVVERFTPVDDKTMYYEATITDPVVYTRPWTIAFSLRRQQDELLEVACHEDNQDLRHLKEIRDAGRKSGGGK